MENKNGYYPETTLRDYVKVLFRHKAVIIVTFITVMAAVVVGLKLKTPVYEAQVKVLISAEKQIESPYYRQLMGYRDGGIARTQAEIVKSNAVIERTVQATGLYQRPLDYEKQFCSPLKKGLIDFQVKRFNKKLERLTEQQKNAFFFRLAEEDLKRTIRVEPIGNTNLFIIKAKELSPIGAAVIANVVSRSYLIFDLEQQLAELQLKYGEKHLSVRQLEDNINKMKEGLTGEPLSNIEAIGPASVKIVEQAQIPLRPAGTPKMLTIILALFLAPFLGIMLAFIFEYTDQRFKSPQDIETFLNLPFLGSIPRRKRIKKEFLHRLSDQIYLLMKDKRLRSLLLTSVLSREGTTTIVANLARHLSQKAGHKVLVIDANLRNPAIHKAFKIPESPGLTDVLEGKVPFEQAVTTPSVIASPFTSSLRGGRRPTKQSQAPINSCLDILPAGRTNTNPLTLLDSPRMIEALNTAKQKYEIIFIDCANLKNFKDAVVLSSSLDSVAIVINESRTRRQVVKTAITSLEQKNGKLIGAILNNRHFVIPKVLYDRV